MTKNVICLGNLLYGFDWVMYFRVFYAFCGVNSFHTHRNVLLYRKPPEFNRIHLFPHHLAIYFDRSVTIFTIFLITFTPVSSIYPLKSLNSICCGESWQDYTFRINKPFLAFKSQELQTNLFGLKRYFFGDDFEVF